MSKGRTHEYCLTAWNNLKANAYRWNYNLNKDAERSISRMFYQAVFDTSPDRTGLYTKDMGGCRGSTDDHYMIPQTVAKFVMETPEYLNDFDKFEELFLLCRRTIAVSSGQNMALRNMTKKQPVLTKDKYHHLGYDLYFDNEKLAERHQVLDVPEDFTEWESKFIDNQFRPTVVYRPKLQTLEEFMA